jgi:hypothetical protein
MLPNDLQQYLDRLRLESPEGLYVPRRFSAASDEGDAEPDLARQFRGISREREPLLPEVLKHPRVIVLGEPGAGKSLIARAAVRSLLQDHDRTPIYCELKQYRPDDGLPKLLGRCAPPQILEAGSSVEGKLLARTYILDGLDEIPGESLPAFAKELGALFSSDADARIFLTSRQAFYVANRGSLPHMPAVFDILEFSDDDIREYVSKAGADFEAFIRAVRLVDTLEEIRNPLVLDVTLTRFQSTGSLSPLKSDNLSFIIDRLIQSRPFVNQHKQRRALRMLAITMETYCRNELTEPQAIQVIRQASSASEHEANQLLQELYSSILRRTLNGLSFQMRSYQEYLAAEELEGERPDKLRELAFLDYETPNPSWTNCVSYLAELNRSVRRYFVKQFPTWMINSSSAAFSDEEKEQIVNGTLRTIAGDTQYIQGYPGMNVRRLGRFLTQKKEAELLESLKSVDDPVRANSLLLLSWSGKRDVTQAALAVVKDRSLDSRLRVCGVYALINSGDPNVVPKLTPLLKDDDPLHVNIEDAIGAVCSEAQIATVLPIVSGAHAMLSNTFYHFREFKSRRALIETLRYLSLNPDFLTEFRSEGYIEPIIKLIPKYWDTEIAQLCADIIAAIRDHNILLSNMGVSAKLFQLVEEADKDGLVALIYLKSLRTQTGLIEKRHYSVGQIVARLARPATARWLIENDAIDTIKGLSPYLQGEVRDVLRPHSDGLIDQLEKNTMAYLAERAKEEDTQTRALALLQEELLEGRDFGQALDKFSALTESHWPELPTEYRDWINPEISLLMTRLDLENSIEWTGNRLRVPYALPLALRIINRYDLKLDPDTPIVFAIPARHETEAANYYRSHGLSDRAVAAVCSLLNNPKSEHGLGGAVAFLRKAGLWTPSIKASLENVVRDPAAKESQGDALQILASHEIELGLLETIHKTGASEELRNEAFQILVERQDRPTIERALASLLTDEDKVKSGERHPSVAPALGWIAKIRSGFATKKLARLREMALRLELPGEVGLITDTLARIDRARAASIIRRQIPLAPQEWRHLQQIIAIEQERLAKVEKVQNTPFEMVLRKLKGATSINLLKLICEGQTDVPVFKELLSQFPNMPEIAFDFVGGWPSLCAKGDEYFLLGCKKAIVVMDGDLGRQLKKRNRPLTKMARAQEIRLAALSVELNVLERYAIENYFPQWSVEAVSGKDLRMHFPIPEDVSVTEYLREPKKNWKLRLRKFLPSSLQSRVRLSGIPLYAKNKNLEIARRISLERDLIGTDLYDIIQRIAAEASRLADDEG